MSNLAPWHVAQCKDSNYLETILEFLLPEYIRIFGKEVMTTAPCIVYNDPNSLCPQFNHTDPLSIRLSQSSLTFWAQTIYQLSHEMCHYAMYQTKQDKSKTLSWFEEIVCEAMSLYALQYAAQNWHECSLFQVSPDFDAHIRDYLSNELNRTASDGFMQCDSVAKLTSYEFEEKPESDRTTHVSERNRIYKAISKDPTEASCFLHYQWYIQPENGVSFNFDAWLKDDPRNLVVQLLNIFPVKREETAGIF